MFKIENDLQVLKSRYLPSDIFDPTGLFDLFNCMLAELRIHGHKLLNCQAALATLAHSLALHFQNHLQERSCWNPNSDTSLEMKLVYDYLLFQQDLDLHSHPSVTTVLVPLDPSFQPVIYQYATSVCASIRHKTDFIAVC